MNGTKWMTWVIKREVRPLKAINYIDDNKLFVTLYHHERLDYIYSKAFYDKQFFMDFFLSHWQEHRGKVIKSAGVHTEIDEYYQSLDDIVLILPRWHAKTTRILVNVLHDLVYQKGIDLLYLSSSDLGKEAIGKLRIELETNEIIKEVYGSLCPQDQDSTKISKLKKWKQKLLELLNGNSIETMSKWQPMRWRRKHKIIVDDPQENKDVTTKDKCDRFNEYMFTTVYNTMLPGWNMVVMGTIVGRLCFVIHLRDEKKRRCIERKAIEKWKPLRPSLRSLEALAARQRKIGTPLFNQEFMHIPMSREDALIRLSWIKYRDTKPRFDRIVVAVDPATKTKEKNDFTGICVGGVSGEDYYEIYSRKIKLSPTKLELFIEKVYHVFKCNYIIKEDNIEVGITERLAEKWLPIVWVVTSKDKYSRLVEVSPFIERWDVYFNPKSQDLIEQLINFPDIPHDDVMDAFMLMMQYVKEVSNQDIYVLKA